VRERARVRPEVLLVAIPTRGEFVAGVGCGLRRQHQQTNERDSQGESNTYSFGEVHSGSTLT
jgi:hypothetical protein